MSAPLLEIAADGVGSALAAQAGGADRVELCTALGEGGTTPSYGVIATARDRLRIPLYVLVRPRAGDFFYDAAELDAMHRDIEACVRLGCDGVVLGALDADGAVDLSACRSLIGAAAGLGVTFHRAFDAARDPAAALEAVVALGCERVLTSGAQASAVAGADAIAACVHQAAGRLRVMAGAGVTTEELAGLVARSHAHEYHASAKALRHSAMRHRNPALHGLDADWWQSDTDRVRALVSALQAAASMTDEQQAAMPRGAQP